VLPRFLILAKCSAGVAVDPFAELADAALPLDGLTSSGSADSDSMPSVTDDANGTSAFAPTGRDGKLRNRICSASGQLPEREREMQVMYVLAMQIGYVMLEC
jgi:hypothetical protein